MTAEQFLTPDFICQLSGAVDRYYDSEQGAFHEGYEHFHNAAGQATIVKAAAEDLGMSCKIVGNEAIPEDGDHMERGSGYDWAVVDNRWVVDLWAVSYSQCVDTVVMDMQDPQQRDWVIRSLGPVESWEELPTDPKEMEIAKAIWHNFSLPYHAVDDLLGGVTERQCASLESWSQGNTCAGSSPAPSAILEELLCESPKIETLKKHKQPLSPEEQAQVAAVKLPHGDCASWWKAEHDGKTWYVVHTHRAGQVRPSLKSALAVYPQIASTA